MIGERDTMTNKEIPVPSTAELKSLVAKSRKAAKNSRVTPADVEKAVADERSLVKELERIQREESGRGISLDEAAEKWHIKS